MGGEGGHNCGNTGIRNFHDVDLGNGLSERSWEVDVVISVGQGTYGLECGDIPRAQEAVNGVRRGCQYVDSI